MEDKIHFSKFSESEAPYFERFQKWRDSFFQPLCVFFTKAGVKPDHLTYLSVLLMLPFVFFLQQLPIVSLISLVLSVFLDAVDGPLARHQKTQSAHGFFMDLVADHLVLFTFVLALIYFKFIDGFWGAAYSLNYLLMIVMIVVMSALKMKIFTVWKSKFLLYLAWTLAIFFGFNFLDIFLVFFSIYMFLTNLFLLYKFRCSLKS